MDAAEGRWLTSTTVLPSLFSERLRSMTVSFRLSRLLVGLVEQDEGSIMEQHPCQAKPLPLATG